MPRFVRIICLFCVFLFPLFCQNTEKNQETERDFVFISLATAGYDILDEARAKIGIFPRIPKGAENDTPSQIQLGSRIFQDKTLSLNSAQSCSTCHLLSGRNIGTDGQSVSRGTFGQLGRRNVLSILNVGHLETLFWDGRMDSLESQALLPFTDANEMALPSQTELLNRFNQGSAYSSEFTIAFPENPNINISNIGRAIAAFERSLNSRSRFDDFMDGNVFALSSEEKIGLKLFLNLNCISCHSGPMLGGKKFAKLDSVYSYNATDLGRFEVTGNSNDRFFFRTPSLRNVASTQPYFHDGSVSSLSEAVRRMNHYEAPRPISEQEVQTLVIFLRSLSDSTRPSP